MTGRIIPFSMLLAFAGFTLWTVSDALIKFLRTYPSFEVAWVAVTAGLIVQLVFVRQLGGLRRTLSMPKQKWQIARGILFVITTLIGYYIFARLPLAFAYAIIFMTPFLTKIFSVVFLKERISVLSWVITAMGFIGVLIVLRPGIVPLTLPVVLALCNPVFFALGNIITRYIGEENQTWLSYNLYIDVPIVVLLAYPAYAAYVPMPAMDLLLTSVIGICGLVGTIIVGKAFAAAPSRYIAPIHYIQIVWGTIWGILIFREYPDMWTLIGSAVIVLAGIGLIVISQDKKA